MTRFNNGIYDREDAKDWMQDRIKLFKLTRESVLSQKGDFKWIISFDERTPKNVIDKCITDDRMIVTFKDVRECFSEIEVDTDWVITTRLDNDDIYLDGAVEAIQENFNNYVHVIDIDYFQYETKTNKKFTSNRKAANSPFLSLVEPSNYVRTCYCRPHHLLLSGYPSESGEKISIPAKKINNPFALMVIHSDNMANKIVGEEV